MRRRYGGGFHGCRWGRWRRRSRRPGTSRFRAWQCITRLYFHISPTTTHLQYIGTDEDLHGGIDDPLDVAQRCQIRLEGSGVIEMGVVAEKLEVADLVG